MTGASGGTRTGGRLRVLVVDDDDLMRAGLRAVLSSDETIEVVGEAADGFEAVTRVRQTRPDVVLMDVRMPRLDGIAATRKISALAPAGEISALAPAGEISASAPAGEISASAPAGEISGSGRARILILTTFEDEDYIFDALHAGASGFLLKRTRPEQLIAAIHAIAVGDSLLSPSVTRTVIERMARSPRPDPAAARRLRSLTPREREVLELVARGLANAEIAATLVVEESTVKTHLKRIMAKLELRDRVQAVILAYETGLIRPGEPGRATAG